jgi:hypothetical protein
MYPRAVDAAAPTRFLTALDDEVWLATRLLPVRLVALDLVDPEARAQRFVGQLLGMLGRVSDPDANADPSLADVQASFRMRDRALRIEDLPGLKGWLGDVVLQAYASDVESRFRKVRPFPFLGRPRLELVRGGLVGLATAALQALRFPGQYADLDTQFLHDLVLYGLREALANAHRLAPLGEDPEIARWAIEGCAWVASRFQARAYEAFRVLDADFDAWGGASHVDDFTRLNAHTRLAYGGGEDDRDGPVRQMPGVCSFDGLGRPAGGNPVVHAAIARALADE